MPGRSFYTVADSAYFLGAVALVNSLRLAGHAEPIVVLDSGLEPHQRELLEREATLVPAPSGKHPMYVKWFVMLDRPADVMAFVDADIAVLRSLEPLLELAGDGKVVAFEDLNPVRYQPEWAELVGRPVERRTYVNSGFLALRGRRDLLQRLHDAQQRITQGPVAGTERRPFKFPDQDVLNAVLGAYVLREETAVIERRLGPVQPFSRLRLVDADRLDLRYRDGATPYLLHHLYEKPWLQRTPTNPYTRILPRLLLGDDVALRPRVEEVPWRLRPGFVPGRARDALAVPALATRARFKARQLVREARGRGLESPS
jgi:hypothetical protein